MASYPNPILNAVATGSTAARLVQDRFAFTLILDDYRLPADTDFSNAFDAAIVRATALGGAVIDLGAKTYLISRTIAVASPNIVIRGLGKGLTVIARNRAFADTILFNNGGQLINCGVRDLSLFHDITGGAVMTGAHINVVGTATFLVENVDFTFGAFGTTIYGGVYIRYVNCHFVGIYNAGIPVQNGTTGAILLPTTNAGAVPIPTLVDFENCTWNGIGVDSNWQYGTVINACEQANFSACTWNTGPLFNIYIQQRADNQPILEVSFGNGCFVDACQEAGVFIDGSLGNGSQPIDRIRFNDTSFNGEGVVPILGPGVGIMVDGTSRGGIYDQALQSLEITGCTIQGYYSDGMRLNGGSNYVITGSHIKDNNHSLAAGVAQITIGAAVKHAVITGNRIGGAITAGSVSTAKYGVQVANGATGIVILGNDVTGNTTANILDNSTATPKIIANNPGFNGNRPSVAPAVPASTVAYTNGFGAPAMLSIFGGAVSSISLNGTVIATATGIFLTVGANDVIAITYTVVPSWIFWPQ